MNVRLLGTALSALVIVAWFFTLRPVAMGGPMGYINVSGHSMEPTFWTGDLVLTRKQADYNVGDIVAFKADGKGMVIHRIIGGNGTDGYEMQGDNNSWVDSWNPTNDEIVGKKFVHVAGLAKKLAWFQDPARMTALFGGVAAFGLIKVGNDKPRRKRRKDGQHMKASEQGANGGGSGSAPGLTPAMVAFGAVALGTILLAVAAVFAYRDDEVTVVKDTKTTYEQAGTFQYYVHLEKSTLYPTGLIGPVIALPGGSKTTEIPPVYTKLARNIDLGFRYNLMSAGASDLRGEVRADLQIKALGDGGWTTLEPLAEPVAFEGTEAAIPISFPLQAYQRLIETVEDETGFRPVGYELSIIPTVHIQGTVDGKPFEQTYAPPFKMTYNKTTLSFDSNLTRREPHTETITTTETQQWGLGLAVADARPILSALTAAALVVTAVLAAVAFLGFGQPEEQRLRARYGTRLVSVTETESTANRVQVSRLEDLAVLASRDGRIIFRHETPGSQVFFVPDGPTTYEFARPSSNGGVFADFEEEL